MKRIIVLLSAFALFNCSCKTGTHQEDNNAVKDSLLLKYFSIVDTLPYYDTSAIEFKFLKALSSNDTSTLKKLIQHLQYRNTKPEWTHNLDSCVKQQAFKDINAVEKYQFIYSAAFCPYTTSATIIKYKDSAVLNTIVYQYAWDTLPCKIIDQSSISIDSLRWSKFQESLEGADFWGAKADNGIHGFDGSTIEVYGFKKGTDPEWNPDKSSYISRWSPANLCILSTFTLLLQFSKTKKGCLWVM